MQKTKQAKDLRNAYWQKARGRHEELMLVSFNLRATLVKEYAWAISDPAVLDFIAEHTRHTGIIEIGAGNGWWASLLTQLGVLPYTCFDDAPPNRMHNHWLNDDKTYYEVRIGGPEEAINYPERTLFLCWPPYNTDMAEKTLRAFTGTRLVFIGEDEGGCTASEQFFWDLDEAWNEIATHPIAQWDGIHDSARVYERKASE